MDSQTVQDFREDQRARRARAMREGVADAPAWQDDRARGFHTNVIRYPFPNIIGLRG